MSVQHRPDTSHKLIEGERFGYIVIVSQIQGTHLVRHSTPRSKHDDVNVVMKLQATAQLEAIKAGQSDIDQHSMWEALFRRDQARFTVHGSIDLEPLVSEAPA